MKLFIQVIFLISFLDKLTDLKMRDDIIWTCSKDGTIKRIAYKDEIGDFNI